MHDVFVSYQHESKTIADNIVSVLEQNRIRCWYAPRDVRGDYATSIVEAIRSCKAFVVIVNEQSTSAPHVLNEVEIAFKQLSEGKISAILPFKLDESELSAAMEYYIKRMHWIDATSVGLESAINDLIKQLSPLLPSAVPAMQDANNHGAPSSSRKRETYYKSSSSKEQMRLNLQQKIFRDFDIGYYEDALCGKSGALVLDLGSSTGDKIVNRIGSSDEVGTLLGIDSDEKAVSIATIRHGAPNRIFQTVDMESADFEKELDDFLVRHGASGFDVVFASMILLHLKNPYMTLKKVRRRMNPGGRIVVVDIDDALKLVYPDLHGYFAKAIAIDDYTDVSGFRQSGRQIYGFLQRAGFVDIKLESEGLTTIGMNTSQKEALFETCFAYIGENLEIQCENHPEEKRYAEDLAWFEETYELMEEEFMSDDLFFQAPMMVFTAQVAEDCL